MTVSDITVVIPTYNAAAFLVETLRSVFAQTELPAEVIVVDDASPDATCEVVERLAKRAPCPVRLIRRAVGSGGPAVPMNEGVAAARTEWIALLDHDDRMLPEKLAAQARAVRMTDATLAFSDYRFFNDEQEVWSGLRAEQIGLFDRGRPYPGGLRLVPCDVLLQEQILDPGLVQSCSNLLFRKELWEGWGPFDAARSAIADHVFKLKVAAENPAVFVPQVLFEKRVHRGNLFTASDGLALRLEIFELGLAAVRKHPELTIADRSFRDRLRFVLNDAGYHWRQAGLLGASLQMYRNSLEVGGWSADTVGQIVKWPLGVARNWMVGSRRPAESGVRAAGVTDEVRISG